MFLPKHVSKFVLLFKNDIDNTRYFQNHSKYPVLPLDLNLDNITFDAEDHVCNNRNFITNYRNRTYRLK